MLKIQTEMTERAIQLLNLESGQPAYILDIGAGTGLSGEVLTSKGYQWIGVDISPAMLGVALQRGVEGDLICADMGQGFNFREGSFDGCISISAIQWLFNADQSHHVPYRRINRFFASLYRVLARGARAVFQLYPESPEQLNILMIAAQKAGFNGGIVIDYPNSTKAKKFYMCLLAGEPDKFKPYNPKPLTGMHDGSDYEDDEDDASSDVEEQKTVLVGKTLSGSAKMANLRFGHGVDRIIKLKKKVESYKEFVQRKKTRMRKQGKDIALDSKYSGRSRGPKF